MMINKNNILLLILCVSFVFSAPAKVVAAISSLKGSVMVKPAGSRKYIPAYKGQMLKNGEWLKTSDGVFIAIVFLDGSNIKIQQKTELRITSYRMTAKELKTSLEMTKGQAWSNVAKQGAAGEFTIQTPTAVASVKGTELDVKIDEESDGTSLTVSSGEVFLDGPLGQVMVGAMQQSENGGPPKKITKDQLPQWQKKTDPKWGFKLKADKQSKVQVEQVVKVTIQIVNAKNRKFNNSFAGESQVTSQGDLQVSADGSSWSGSTNINIANGRGLVFVKSSKQGQFDINVSSGDAESRKLSFEYYQSATQKKAADDKIGEFASKKGFQKLADAIEGKVLQKSQVISGSGNVSDVINKLLTNELQLDGDPDIIENDDGTVSIKLKVKPR